MILALSAGPGSPAELRARLALDEAAQRRLLLAQGRGAGELVVLCTCHRTEAYGTADGQASEAFHALAALLPDLRATDYHDLRFMEGLEAVEHLFRVAGGLESLMVGEPQVLGQVRRAYVAAKQAGAAGPVLCSIFDRAIRLGRRVRADTSLARLGQSFGGAVVRYLAAHFEKLDGRPGAIVGAGEAAADAGRSLSRAGTRLSIVSRSEGSAVRLAAQIGASADRLDNLKAVLESSDFAVVAVSGGVLLRPYHLPERGRKDPFVILDLSVPPAVEVDGRADVDLRTLEDFPAPRSPEITAAIMDAETMVKKEVAELGRRIETRPAGSAIRELRGRSESLVTEEVARALAGMDLGAEERERIAALGMRIANKLLHGPTTALRDADEKTREVIKRLFGLEA